MYLMPVQSSPPKRILYLSYDGMTDPLGQSQVLPYLIRLTEHGYRYTLLSCEKPERLAKGKERIERLCTEHGIEWHPLPYTKSPPILSTMADLRRMRKLAIRLHKDSPFEAVHCRGHLPGLVGLYLKRHLGIKFIFDNRGFYADEKVDAGAWNLANPIYRTVYRYFKRKEKGMIEESDHMVCLTHAGKADMLRWKGVSARADRITVVPCCADTEHFSPQNGAAKSEHLRAELGIASQDVILSYLGSIGTWYMLDEMLDFFVEFRKAYPCARFLFITQDEHARIRSTAGAKGLSDDAVIIRPGARDEVPGLLALSQFSLFFIRPTYSKISSSPTKQGEIMAMGIPAICNAGVGDSDDIITGRQAGVLVKDFTTESYNHTIDQLRRGHFDPMHIRQGANSVFSLDSGITEYLDVYRKALAI